jgi:serine/threonine-protein kinase
MLPPLANDTILRNRYQITNIVGRGGMGSIYQAEDLRLPGRLCAIKEVQPDPNAFPAIQEQARQQFLQEASILARLDHPNLPKVSDFFNYADRDYLVMDFVPGRDLHQMAEEYWGRGNPLPVDQVLNWTVQIVDALTYLHQHDPPVLHRDIKPSNIKLTPDGRIKLVDFGLVKLMDQDDARTITVVQGRGSAMYTPLEQYGGDTGHTDVRSDIYALGASLYQLLTGIAPPSAKARFLHPDRLRPLSELNPAVPQAVGEAVLWALEMHPDDRPADLNQFCEVLFGERRRPQVTDPRSFRPGLGDAIRKNQTLFLVVLALFALAILLTIL